MRAMDNPHKRYSGINRIVRAATHSLDGLKVGLVQESAFRQETVLALVLVPAAFWVGRGAFETAVLAVSVIGVLVVELLNSAIEHTVDRVSLEPHALSKSAKDLASAAVLLALLACAALWVAALWSRWHG